MTAQAAELASGKAQSFLSSKAGSVPFGYVPTTFLIRGSSPSGMSRLLFYSVVRPLRERPDYFSTQGSVPFGYVPTTLLLMGQSPSGTSRLFFYSGVIPFEYVPTTFLHRGQSPSDTSRLLFCIGVHPLRVRPDYFSAQGFVPFRSFSAFRVKNRHSRVNSASRAPARAPEPALLVRLHACVPARASYASRAPLVHSSRTPRAPSSSNVHALAPEHSSKRSTESLDSRTLPRLFPRIPRQVCRKMVWIVVRKTIPTRKWQASSRPSL
ncbi:hypothetical protein CRG98_005093 [Punica granatum]|uniref:Uncharacterized protein n=1 Tax=Punica granatum TaxID=22663 RepID=A0A2I0L2Z4_PUNGR|nr:hypothetical protein CRG98_005093 [Punica granatum]